jgi:hypothetical protein
MLVRNLRKVGDYERSILSQEENLRMAIANDRNIAQARSQVVKGMVPELTPDQMKSKEEELTDKIAIQAKAQENLLTLYSKEKVAKFMDGLTTELMTYLNVYWNDLKPVFKNKTGLTKTYFDRILKQHIQTITDARGMSTVQSSGARNSALNELAEARKLGFGFLMGTKIIDDLIGKMGTASIGRPWSKAALTKANLSKLKSSLPSEQILAKVETKPETEKQKFYSDLISLFQGMIDPNEAAWKDALLSEPSESQRKIDERLLQTITPRLTEKLRALYAPYI